MKKLPFKRQVCFQSGKVSEINRQNQDEKESSPEKVENRTHSRSRTLTISQNYEFPY